MSDQDAVTRLNAVLEGRYRIERQLGEGGMATVYLAHDLRHERKVALKVLKPELAAVVGADRFLAEIKTTANLQHPHILPLFDSGEADSFLFYVMPYVEGESLRERLDREHQLPVDEAVQIAKDVAEALQAAHDQGVIHRDVKPANILLSKGRPLVSDFGIALAVSAGGAGRLTETGLSLGTPRYMSPEQATGDQSVGAATDIYALGCVLYEMLVGEPPFTGSTPQAVLGKIVAGDPPSATAQRKSVPPNVDAAIRKALEKLPADRFASASTFARALSDKPFRHGGHAEADGARDTSPWNPLSIAASGMAVILAAILIWMMGRPPAPRAVTRLEVVLPEGLSPNSNLGVNLAMSPEGAQFVFAGGGQLWRRPLDRLEPVPMSGTRGGVNPRFSPDGEQVAFIVPTNPVLTFGRLIVARLNGAPPRTVVQDSVSIDGLAWGSDEMLYYKKVGSGIWRVSANGGTPEPVTESLNHRFPEALPASRGLLVTLNHDDLTEDSIGVVSFETGQVTTLVAGTVARYSPSGHLVYASTGGTLLAVPFDLDHLEVTGPPRPVGEGGIEVNRGVAQFALSQDGALAYRPGTGGGGERLPFWIDREGSQTLLGDMRSGEFMAPAISPDGGRIAFLHRPVGGDWDIWVYTIAARAFSPLHLGVDANTYPFWSPDGSEIGFTATLDQPLRAVYSVLADGSESTPRLLVRMPDRDIYEALWTPDYTRIVYRAGTTTGGDTDFYHAAPPPESVPSVLFDNPFVVFSPALSPDGRWLAYTSQESGRFEVYVRRYPGPGTPVPVSVEGGKNPVWSSSGSEIVYIAPYGSGIVTVAAVRTEPDFTVLAREPHPEWPRLFSFANTQTFDVSSVDGRILGLQGAVGQTNIVIVQNWSTELCEQMGDC